ncbi:MAG: CerR family C-terminal domain-containing protein [Pseudomonadota bacterium]
MSDQTDQDAAQPPEAASEQTKYAILEAAIKLFGAKGFEATTVRDLITEADVNLAAVNYHFGGKDGLRMAVIDHLATQFRQKGPGVALAGLDQAEIGIMSPEKARETLRFIMKTSFKMAASGGGPDLRARYIQRELIQGGEPTERFFEKVFSFQFNLMVQLVARATERAVDDEITRVRAINLIAQSVFLNLARPLVLLALGWDEYTPENVDLVGDAFWLHHE